MKGSKYELNRAAEISQVIRDSQHGFVRGDTVTNLSEFFKVLMRVECSVINATVYMDFNKVPNESWF